MKTVKLASAQVLRRAADRRGTSTAQAFRDLELEQKLLEAREQARHRRAVRRQVLRPRRPRRPPAAPRRLLPGRRWASPARPTATSRRRSPRRALARGARPRARRASSRAQYRTGKHEHGVKIDLNRPMKEILAELSKHPVSTPLLLTGTIVVGARHRPRQVQGAPRRRARRVPEYLQEPPDLLRRPGQDAEGQGRPAPSARPPPAAWTPTSTCSSRTARRW